MSSLQSIQCGRFQLTRYQPLIMGILNLTPDSFSDGGKHNQYKKAILHARAMIEAGADIIDIGAESTRPGSDSISIEEELERLHAVVTTLVEEGNIPISIDTKKSTVMEEVISWGVDMINDVNALKDINAVNIVSNSRCAVCLMHMPRMPKNLQEPVQYDHLINDIANYLQQRVEDCKHAGISDERLILDPGFGFGKTPVENLRLVKNAKRFGLGVYPVLLGVSRKSTIGNILAEPRPDKRVLGSIILSFAAMEAGAHILRVHDIAETIQARKIYNALRLA